MEISKEEKNRILKGLKEYLIKKYGLENFNKNHILINQKPKGRIK